jgi:hypothetical protein
VIEVTTSVPWGKQRNVDDATMNSQSGSNVELGLSGEWPHRRLEDEGLKHKQATGSPFEFDFALVLRHLWEIAHKCDLSSTASDKDHTDFV